MAALDALEADEEDEEEEEEEEESLDALELAPFPEPLDALVEVAPPAALVAPSVSLGEEEHAAKIAMGNAKRSSEARSIREV